jgi:hypothetical protein
VGSARQRQGKVTVRRAPTWRNGIREPQVIRWKASSPALIKKQRLDWGYQFYKTEPNRLYKPKIALMTNLLVEFPPSLNLSSQTKSKTEKSILTT